MKQIVILSISCALVACASTENGAPESAGESRARSSDCIFEGTIRDYRVLDGSNLIVTGSGQRKYHIELARRAFGLSSSWHIGFSSPTNRICPGFSEVVVDDTMGPEAIRITSIRRLSPEEYEDLLIRFGKLEPEIEQTPAPEPVEGAEVEELD